MLFEGWFLAPFGVKPTEYASLDDFLTLAFRQPENLPLVLFQYIAGPIILFYLIPRFTKLSKSLEKILSLRTYIVCNFIVLTILSMISLHYNAQIRSEQIINYSGLPDEKLPLNNISVASISLRGTQFVDKGKNEELVYLSKLGNTYFFYATSSGETLLIPNISVNSIFFRSISSRHASSALSRSQSNEKVSLPRTVETRSSTKLQSQATLDQPDKPDSETPLKKAENE